MLENVTERDGKIVVRVPVSYEMYGRLECEFDSLEEMKEKLNDADYLHSLPLPHSAEYMEESFQVHHDMLAEDVDNYTHLKQKNKERADQLIDASLYTKETDEKGTKT